MKPKPKEQDTLLNRKVIINYDPKNINSPYAGLRGRVINIETHTTEKDIRYQIHFSKSDLTNREPNDIWLTRKEFTLT